MSAVPAAVPATNGQATQVQRERDPALHQWAVEHCATHFRGNRAAFASEMGFSRSALSKWLDRRYVANTRIEESIAQYRARQDRLASDGQFVRTHIASEVIGACRYAMERRKLVAIVGRAGGGKSTALQEFMRRAVESGVSASSLVYVIARSVTTAASVMRRIALELGIPARGVIDELTDRVIAKLKKDPRLIVIDDAAFLNVKALHLVRTLYDEAGAGVVLVGIRELMDRILHATGRLGEDLAQIRSRVALVCELDQALGKSEAVEIARRRAPDLDAAEIELIAGKQRCARALVHVVERVQAIRRMNPGEAIADVIEAAESEVLEAAV
jgi:DNA transposition AAA+ family ATPase